MSHPELPGNLGRSAMKAQIGPTPRFPHHLDLQPVHPTADARPKRLGGCLFGGKSSGQALVTGAGLVPVPIPSPVLPAGLVSLFGGDSYAFSLASSPVRKLLLSASYAKALSNTSSQTITPANTLQVIASSNTNSQFSSLVQYQYRKLYFTSGYARLEQGFSITGSKPEIISSYYMGLSRWFNFF